MENDANVDRSCRALMKRIRALDFAIQETVLYLDAYPRCVKALEHYHALVEQRESAVAEYQRLCGPITACGNKNKTTWQWISSPWPWEYEAN